MVQVLLNFSVVHPCGANPSRVVNRRKMGSRYPRIRHAAPGSLDGSSPALPLTAHSGNSNNKRPLVEVGLEGVIEVVGLNK
jgi:hypothetical protein